MPIRKKGDKWYWGSQEFESRKKAEEVAQAAHASGYEGNIDKVHSYAETSDSKPTPHFHEKPYTSTPDMELILKTIEQALLKEGADGGAAGLGGTVFTSSHAGIFTPTFGGSGVKRIHRKNKRQNGKKRRKLMGKDKKNGVDRLVAFLREGSPDMRKAVDKHINGMPQGGSAAGENKTPLKQIDWVKREKGISKIEDHPTMGMSNGGDNSETPKMQEAGIAASYPSRENPTTGAKHVAKAPNWNSRNFDMQKASPFPDQPYYFEPGRYEEQGEGEDRRFVPPPGTESGGTDDPKAFPDRKYPDSWPEPSVDTHPNIQNSYLVQKQDEYGEYERYKKILENSPHGVATLREHHLGHKAIDQLAQEKITGGDRKLTHVINWWDADHPMYPYNDWQSSGKRTMSTNMPYNPDAKIGLWDFHRNYLDGFIDHHNDQMKPKKIGGSSWQDYGGEGQHPAVSDVNNLKRVTERMMQQGVYNPNDVEDVPKDFPQYKAIQNADSGGARASVGPPTSQNTKAATGPHPQAAFTEKFDDKEKKNQVIVENDFENKTKKHDNKEDEPTMGQDGRTAMATKGMGDYPNSNMQMMEKEWGSGPDSFAQDDLNREATEWFPDEEETEKDKQWAEKLKKFHKSFIEKGYPDPLISALLSLDNE